MSFLRRLFSGLRSSAKSPPLADNEDDSTRFTQELKRELLDTLQRVKEPQAQRILWSKTVEVLNTGRARRLRERALSRKRAQKSVATHSELSAPSRQAHSVLRTGASAASQDRGAAVVKSVRFVGTPSAPLSPSSPSDLIIVESGDNALSSRGEQPGDSDVSLSELEESSSASDSSPSDLVECDLSSSDASVVSDSASSDDLASGASASEDLASDNGSASDTDGPASDDFVSDDEVYLVDRDYRLPLSAQGSHSCQLDELLEGNPHIGVSSESESSFTDSGEDGEEAEATQGAQGSKSSFMVSCSPPAYSEDGIKLQHDLLDTHTPRNEEDDEHPSANDCRGSCCGVVSLLLDSTDDDDVAEHWRECSPSACSASTSTLKQDTNSSGSAISTQDAQLDFATRFPESESSSDDSVEPRSDPGDGSKPSYSPNLKVGPIEADEDEQDVLASVASSVERSSQKSEINSVYDAVSRAVKNYSPDDGQADSNDSDADGSGWAIAAVRHASAVDLDSRCRDCDCGAALATRARNEEEEDARYDSIQRIPNTTIPSFVNPENWDTVYEPHAPRLEVERLDSSAKHEDGREHACCEIVKLASDDGSGSESSASISSAVNHQTGSESEADSSRLAIELGDSGQSDAEEGTFIFGVRKIVNDSDSDSDSTGVLGSDSSDESAEETSIWNLKRPDNVSHQALPAGALDSPSHDQVRRTARKHIKFDERGLLAELAEAGRSSNKRLRDFDRADFDRADSDEPDAGEIYFPWPKRMNHGHHQGHHNGHHRHGSRPRHHVFWFDE